MINIAETNLSYVIWTSVEDNNNVLHKLFFNEDLVPICQLSKATYELEIHLRANKCVKIELKSKSDGKTTISIDGKTLKHYGDLLTSGNLDFNEKDSEMLKEKSKDKHFNYLKACKKYLISCLNLLDFKFSF